MIKLFKNVLPLILEVPIIFVSFDNVVIPGTFNDAAQLEVSTLPFGLVNIEPLKSNDPLSLN